MRKATSIAIAATVNKDAMKHFTYVTVLTAATLLLLNAPAFADDPAAASAGAGSPMGAVLCTVVGLVLGDIGRGLATLAVIVVGIGAMLGKVSWGMAMTVAVGIAVVFGAPAIVGLLGVNGGGCASGGMIIAGGYGAGSGQYGYNGGYGAANDACYRSGTNGTKDTMTSIKCGASVANDIGNAAGQLNNVLNGSGSTESGGILGSFR